MKRFFTFLLITLGATPLLYSQVTMTKASHGFETGQSHEVQAVQYQSPGESGKNCVWDFSKAAALDKAVSTSNLTEENSTLGTVSASRDDDGSEFFFTNTESANEYWGYKVGNVTCQLTEPIVKTKYPQTYGTQFSGKYAGTITNANHSQQVEGTYSTNADGVGTIIFPDGISLPALRVKTIEGTASFERIKYLWYAQNVRLPLFVTVEDYSIAVDGTQKLLASGSYLNTRVKDSENVQSPADSFSYQVSPNPFRDEIQINYTVSGKDLVTVELYDASGGSKLATLASQVQSGAQTVSKDVSKYVKLPGVYLLKITVGDKVYTEKLLKVY